MLEGKQSIISRSRRAFIRGRTPHVASLLIQAWPDRIAVTEAALNAIPGVESHGSAGPGKLIVTIDVDDDTGLVEAVSRIEGTKGVITASLVYHQMDEGDAS
tara:strand:- start:92700 stop:93005 length:306 start_codon:yes stop_codon:yes gene_type:complete